MALFVVYKVISWRIGLGLCYCCLGPTGVLHNFDALTGLFGLIYLAVCLMDLFINRGGSRDIKWNVIFCLVIVLRYFNNLMDKEEA